MADALILGCGYTGLRLGRRLIDAGHRVTGTSRDPDRLDRLEEEGIRPLRVDVSSRDDVRKLEEEAPHVCFYLVPPVSGGGGAELEAVIRALRRAPLEAFVYGSSTSVYGDRDGDRVDETDVPDPDSPTGRARLEAERTVLRCGWTRDCRPRIGRISGIYGPGRTLRGAIEAGRYHLVEGLDAWTNRIHVDDLAAGLEAIWRRGENGRVYNLVDDEPHRSADFARLVAELAGLEPTSLSPEEARERYSESRWARKAGSKRVSNRRLREELGVELAYPTFREGVPAALREEGVEFGEG
jgi:nucleoside-diphosphate-sugar epimerase